MKKYFEQLEALGRKTIEDLREKDRQIASGRENFRQLVKEGYLTQSGYKAEIEKLENDRAEVVRQFQAKVQELQTDFNKTVDDAMMPRGDQIDDEDAALLKAMELTPREFDRLVEKHQNNPTMGRLLEQYRKDHEGLILKTTPGRMLGELQEVKWHTEWKLQTAEDQKEIFASTCRSCEYILGWSDKLMADRDGDVTRRVYGAYHNLQGSDPNALQPPAEDPDKKLPLGNFII